MINCALAFLAIPLAGISLVGLLLPIDSSKTSHHLLKFLLSIACGLGIWASSYSILILLPDSKPWMIGAKDFILIIASIRILQWKPLAYHWIPYPRLSLRPLTHRGLLVGFIFSLFTFFSSVALISRWMPDGLTDAFSVWNLRARFFFYEGGSLNSTFSPDLAWSHIDYPLLLPSLTAQVWFFFGETHSFIPVMISVFFGILSLGLIGGLVASKNGLRNAFLAVIVLLTTPFTSMIHSFQYAEPLSACFMLSSFATLILIWDSPEFYRGVILSGIFSSLAAWTKNEGILPMLILMFIIPLMKSGDLNSRIKALGYFILGILPITLLILYFKTHQGALGTPVFVFSPQEIQPQLTDPQRLKIMVQEFGAKLIFFKRWNFFLMAIPLTLWIFRKELISSKALTSILITSLLTLLGFCIILILGRYDLKWQIYTALDRLIYQVWPSLIMVTFIAMKTSDSRSETRHETSLTTPAKL